MMKLTIKIKAMFILLFSLLLVLSAGTALAQGNSQGKGQGKNKNIGVGNSSDGISGRVITNKGVIYTGDPLEISIQFPSGSDLVNDGSVDAYVVIMAPTVTDDADSAADDDSTTTDTTDTTADADVSGDDTPVGTSTALSAPIVLPVSDVASANKTKLFELEQVDLSVLAGGTYQLGLVLTNPGGDPLVIGDWYRGLLGLIDVVGLTITDEAVDFDQDADGVVDDDADGDGLSDDTSSDPDTGSTTAT